LGDIGIGKKICPCLKKNVTNYIKKMPTKFMENSWAYLDCRINVKLDE